MEEKLEKNNREKNQSENQPTQEKTLENVLFLDIETTGLRPETSRITIVGALTNNGLHQFYDDNEEELLTSFSTFQKTTKFDKVITYYGNNFDIPFLQNRMSHHNIPFPTMPPIQTDLYEIRKSEIQSQKDENIKNTYTPLSQSITCEKYGIYVPKNTSSEYLAKLFSKLHNTPNDVCELFLHNAIDLFALSSLYYRMKEFKVISNPVEAFL
jgi:uncharacterized protein YprB with RNaseH-like and TPR domain